MDTSIFDALEEEDLLLIAAVLHRKEKNARTEWVHEILKKKREIWGYYRLVQELRQDGTKFQNYFRVSPTEFKLLDMAQLLERGALPMSLPAVRFRIPLGAEFSEKYHVSPLSILGHC